MYELISKNELVNNLHILLCHINFHMNSQVSMKYICVDGRRQVLINCAHHTLNAINNTITNI